MKPHFGYHQTMTADDHLAGIAAAVADPARARMVCALLDGRSRTATELATIAGITPSTASSHLQKLESNRFIVCTPAGKHRYFRLTGSDAAAAIESLLRLSNPNTPAFRPSTPHHLRFARTCYDHAAGELAVSLHDWMLKSGWIALQGDNYELAPKGATALSAWGVDSTAVHTSRRRFAYPCLDWSERRFHLGGSLGAALLTALERKGWLNKELDSRALQVTRAGKQGLLRLGIKL